MLKIVEVHPSHRADCEYVVLQNHGTLSVSLRGYALCSQTYLFEPALADVDTYVFRVDEIVKPYGRVVLFTGAGCDGWQPTTNGQQCYVAYWQREEATWSHCESVHLLRPESSLRVVSSEARRGAVVA